MVNLRRRSERLRLKNLLKSRIEPTTEDSEPSGGATVTAMVTSRSLDLKLKLCKYKYRGCKRKFTEDDLRVHEKQCRFRWYQCEGKIFANWDCPWKGYHEDIIHHFRKVHPVRTYMTVQNKLYVHINFESDLNDLQLIRRQKQLFWFKHRLMSDQKTAYWLCQYIGPQDEALTYCYEFMIKDGATKFAVTELCHTDAVDAKEIYESGKCVVMTFDQIKSFMKGPGKVNINFKIKKRLMKRRK